jgi:hypothetical protein
MNVRGGLVGGMSRLVREAKAQQQEGAFRDGHRLLTRFNLVRQMTTTAQKGGYDHVSSFKTKLIPDRGSITYCM